MDPDDVAAAAAAWLWFPDDATTFSTEDLLVVRWPDYFGTPPTVLRMTPDGDVDTLLGEAAERAHLWGSTTLDVRVRLDAPALLEETLQDLDAEVVETVDVFALDLGPGTPDLAVPSDVEVRWQLDETTTRDHLAVGIAAFGDGEMPPDARVRELAAEAVEVHREGRGATAVAYLAGRAVASGGLSLVDGVARLWGGGVVPDARGRGAYRAVLASRLEYAVARDASMALVKGRVETSGPILRRAGFAAYGQERDYRISL